MIRKIPLFPTLSAVLKMTLSDLYNSMGYMILVSTIWCLSIFPSFVLIFSNLFYIMKSATNGQAARMVIPLFIYSLLIISFWTGLVTGPVASALFGMHQERKRDYIGFKTFFEYFKKSFWLSARVYWSFSFGVTIIIANFLITLAEPNFFFKVIGLLSLYILFFLLFMQLYFTPLIYYKNKLKDVFRKAFLLVIDNFALTLVIALMLGLVFVICLPTIILLVLIFGAFYITIIDNAFEKISEKYENYEKIEEEQE